MEPRITASMRPFRLVNGDAVNFHKRHGSTRDGSLCIGSLEGTGFQSLYTALNRVICFDQLFHGEPILCKSAIQWKLPKSLAEEQVGLNQISERVVMKLRSL